jgi:5'-nucleotidase
MTDRPPVELQGEALVVEERAAARDGPSRILVTNDDGIDSPGIHAVADRLSRDHTVVVVAPNEDMSGTGTGIGRFDPAAGVELTRVEKEAYEAWTVAGPPGLAVLAAMLGAFGPAPNLVVSGINAGINTGRSIIHSGTVGAALTARSLGASGLAVSLASSRPWHWETAAEIACSAVRWVRAQRGPSLVLNVNVPGLPLSDVRGIHWADLDEFGYVRIALPNPSGSLLEFAVRGSGGGLDPGSDTAMCLDGYATITLLSTVQPAPFPSDPATAIWDPEEFRATG